MGGYLEAKKPAGDVCGSLNSGDVFDNANELVNCIYLNGHLGCDLFSVQSFTEQTGNHPFARAKFLLPLLCLLVGSGIRLFFCRLPEHGISLFV